MRDRLLAAEKVKAIDWRGEALYLLDQRSLPFDETWLACTGAQEVARAIREMVVCGAPAIGIAAAYGVVLAARVRKAAGGDWVAALEEDFALLADSQPTAMNLLLALNRMRDRSTRAKGNADVLQILEAEALAIHESDREANLTMAQLGVDVIRRHQGNAQTVLTHSNAGALATGGFGTALGVIRACLAGGHDRAGLCRRNPARSGGRATHGLGVGERRHSGGAQCGLGCGTHHENQGGDLGDSGR